MVNLHGLMKIIHHLCVTILSWRMGHFQILNWFIKSDMTAIFHPPQTRLSILAVCALRCSYILNATPLHVQPVHIEYTTHCNDPHYITFRLSRMRVMTMPSKIIYMYMYRYIGKLCFHPRVCSKWHISEHAFRHIAFSWCGHTRFSNAVCYWYYS